MRALVYALLLSSINARKYLLIHRFRLCLGLAMSICMSVNTVNTASTRNHSMLGLVMNV